MKNRFLSSLLVFILLASISVSASAATTAGLIYDETEQLLSEDAQYFGNELFYTVTNDTKTAVYIDIYTSIGSAESLYEATEFVYINSNFGYGENKCGFLLSLYVEPNGDSWALNSKDPYALYINGIPQGMDNAILAAAEPFLNNASWAGNLDSDRLIVAGLAEAVANAVLQYDPEVAVSQPEATPLPEVETPPPQESYTRYTPYAGEYLTDSYGLLTEAEQKAIESYAKEASNKHGCGVYALIVDDYTQLNGNKDIFKANYTYYHDNNMGLGENRDGVLLLLSMNQRDFTFFVYGDNAEYAFDSWGQKELENSFIDDFGNNRWYDGLKDYVVCFDEFLLLAENGDPVREPPQSKMALAAGISSFIALLVSSFMWNKNKSVKKRSSAYGYTTGILVPGISEDRYIDTTVKTVLIDSGSDSGSDSDSSRSSVSHSGGGGSGRSGKF